MFSSLFWENTHFAINLFSFLAFVAAFWLHLDAWIAKKRFHSFIGLIGWAALALAFLVTSSRIESTVLTDQFFSDSIYFYIILFLKIVGYSFVAFFTLREPIQLHPKLHKKPVPTKSSTPPSPVSPQKPASPVATPTPAQPAQIEAAKKTAEEEPKKAGRLKSLFTRKEKTQVKADTPKMPSEKAPEKAESQDTSRKSHETGPVVAALGFVFKSITYSSLVPVFALAISISYLRRATTGIERHVKPLFYTFLLFTIYEVLALAPLWRDSLNPSVFKLATAYGPLWIAELLVLLAASSWLLMWVSKYLLLRLKTQLFMIFISMALGAFIVTAIAFSGLLLQNMQSAALDRLQTDARIFRLILEQKQEGIISDAQVLAQDTRLRDLLELKAQAALSEATIPENEDGEVAADATTDPNTLATVAEGEETIATLTQNILLGKQIDTLIITNAEGEVLARGEDPDQTGDSLSDNPLVASARNGNLASGFVKQDSAVAPTISIRAAVPIQDAGQVVGVVLLGEVLDSPFLDGIKRASNLDTILYTENIISASTLENTNDSSRWIGTMETNRDVLDSVLEKKEEIQTSINLLGQPYLASYVPLSNGDNKPIGMLLVGVPEIFILRTAAESIQITFLISAALMIISIPLALFFAHRISRQVN